MTAPNSPLFNSNSFMSLASLDQAAMDAFPEAVYLCAGDVRVLRFNQKAVELWGRTPTVGDPQERFCGSFRLYRTDGTLLPHDRCAMAVALQTGGSFRDQEVVIEEPGVGCRHILLREGVCRMRRFYFHVKNGQVTVLDQEGVEFADEQEAGKEAARRGREIATRSALKGVSPGGLILVVDEQWQPVYGVPFDGDA